MKSEENVIIPLVDWPYCIIERLFDVSPASNSDGIGDVCWPDWSLHFDQIDLVMRHFSWAPFFSLITTFFYLDTEDKS